MNLQVLEYYLAICREKSFSAAAEAIHISQPTLSRQIADLEAELGKQLFIRTRKHYLLALNLYFRRVVYSKSKQYYKATRSHSCYILFHNIENIMIVKIINRTTILFTIMF